MNKDENKMGMNKTGMSTAPIQGPEMLSDLERLTKSPPGSEQATAQNRVRYMAESDQVGSIPMPTTVKGAVKTGLQALQGNEPKLLLDKLGERAAFERTGVRLYDALISKYEGTKGIAGVVSLEKLQEIRAEELRHFQLVSETIVKLGADPTAMTPAADVAAVASMGIQKVLTEPRIGFIDSLEGILIAELADNDAWAMLIALTEKAGLTDVADSFREAYANEQDHLATVRGWLQEIRLGVPSKAGKAA